MIDRADQAQDIYERHEKIMHKRDEEAVNRSSDCCLECGLLIPSERQLALGGTELCADCAADFERRTG